MAIPAIEQAFQRMEGETALRRLVLGFVDRRGPAHVWPENADAMCAGYLLSADEAAAIKATVADIRADDARMAAARRVLWRCLNEPQPDGTVFIDAVDAELLWQALYGQPDRVPDGTKSLT